MSVKAQQWGNTRIVTACAQGWNLTTKAWTLAGMMTILTLNPRESPWICHIWGSALWNTTQVLMYVWHDSQVMILTLSGSPSESDSIIHFRCHEAQRLVIEIPLCVHAEGRLRQIRIFESPKLILPSPPLPGENLAWQTLHSLRIMAFLSPVFSLRVFEKNKNVYIKILCKWPARHLFVLSPVLFRSGDPFNSSSVGGMHYCRG